MKVDQWPVVTRDRVVSAFRNSDDDTAEAPFRTLRAHGWSTAGVRVPVRRDGHLHGGFVIYSSLNVDAARLARHGQSEAATRLADAASRVEVSKVWRSLVAQLAAVTEFEAKSVVSGVVVSETISKLLRQLATVTARARSKEKLVATVYEISAGAVSEKRDGYVVVRSTTGSETAVPTWMVQGISRDQLGDLVALLYERLGSHKAVFEAVPGLDLDTATVGNNISEPPAPYSPFDSTDLRTYQIAEEDLRLFQHPPALLTVMVPVAIEG
jgi:hypothetical protein